MPDNANYFYAAYIILVAMFVGYGISIRVRRNAVAKKLAEAERSK